jgi:hypothetical protein
MHWLLLLLLAAQGSLDDIALAALLADASPPLQ